GSRRISALLRRRNDFNKKFERALGEGIHICKPLGAAGSQRNRALGRADNRDAAMTGRIAVAVAGRSGGAGFAKTPNRAVSLAHAARQKQRIGFRRWPKALHLGVADAEQRRARR